MNRPVDILLVDDNRADMQLAQFALLESGIDHNFHGVESGEAAVSFVRRQEPYCHAPRPDLILLDLNMPGKSGHAVLDELKSDPALKSIPVVILTTSGAPGDIDRAYANHANSYIVKPMDFDDFCNEVAKGLSNYWFRVVELPSKNRRTPGTEELNGQRPTAGLAD